MSTEERRKYLINDIKNEKYDNWEKLIELVEKADDEKINILYGYITTLEKIFERVKKAEWIKDI